MRCQIHQLCSRGNSEILYRLVAEHSNSYWAKANENAMEIMKLKDWQGYRYDKVENVRK